MSHPGAEVSAPCLGPVPLGSLLEKGLGLIMRRVPVALQAEQAIGPHTADHGDGGPPAAHGTNGYGLAFQGGSGRWFP